MDFLKNKHDILTSLQTVKICLINCVVILCFSMQRRLTHLERVKHRLFLCLQVWRRLTHFKEVKIQTIFMFSNAEKINTF